MKRLLILSGKGGTGKTTTAAAFLDFSQARAAADCDVDAPNLHLVSRQRGQPESTEFLGGDKAWIDPNLCTGCGLCQSTCRFHAVQIRDGSCRVQEYSCEGCGVCVYVCPQKAVRLQPDVAGRRELYRGDGVFSTATLKMGRGNSGKLVTQVKMAMLKNAPPTPLAILDGSPGIGCPVMASVSGMDLVLVVAEPSQSGISDLERLCRTVKAAQTALAVCVNKWDISPEHTQKIRQFCQREQIPYVGQIPYDPTASRAINEGFSLAQVQCPVGDALRQVYENTISLLNL